MYSECTQIGTLTSIYCELRGKIEGTPFNRAMCCMASKERMNWHCHNKTHNVVFIMYYVTYGTQAVVSTPIQHSAQLRLVLYDALDHTRPLVTVNLVMNSKHTLSNT